MKQRLLNLLIALDQLAYVLVTLRAGYPGTFQAEGIAFAAWMDQCNALAYNLLAEVVAGTRPLPESPKALIDLMPPMVWPSAVVVA